MSRGGALAANMGKIVPLFSTIFLVPSENEPFLGNI